MREMDWAEKAAIGVLMNFKASNEGQHYQLIADALRAERSATEQRVRAEMGWRDVENDPAPYDEEVLLYCPEVGISNRERIEFGCLRTSRGSHHAFATHWKRIDRAPPTASGDNDKGDEG